MPIGPLWAPLLDAPTPLTFHDKIKKLRERGTAPTHRGFVAAISQATSLPGPDGFHEHVSDESVGDSEQPSRLLKSEWPAAAIKQPPQVFAWTASDHRSRDRSRDAGRPIRLAGNEVSFEVVHRP